AKEGEVLIISSVSYGTREIKISDINTPLILALEKNISQLDEVQYIAYGQTTKRFTTGNTNTVSASDIAKQPINNPLLALQGRVPGLYIEQASGLPGSGVTVRIQGQNSMNSGNDPLYVIDGIPYSSQLIRSTWPTLLGSSGNTVASGNPFSFINAADIESISVLKDADATAIYGSRAANGAILVTTKKGKSGPTRFDISYQNGWAKVPKMMELLNTNQYLEMRHEALKNDGIANPGPTDYDINGSWDTTRFTDWQKELIGGTAQYSDLQLNISGGNGTVRYLLGGTYHKETSVFPGDLSDAKSAIHFNISNISTDRRFKLEFTGNYLNDDNELPARDLTADALKLPPHSPSLYNADGTLNWATRSDGIATWRNPLSYLLQRFRIRTSNLLVNSLIAYEFLPGLELKSSFGFNKLATNENISFPSIAEAPQDRPFFPRVGVFGNGNIQSWIVEPQVVYNRSIGDLKCDILIGSTFQQTKTNQISVAGLGYTNDLILEDLSAAANIINWAPTIARDYKYNSIYGRAGFNVYDKYIINFTARRDGSSRFGKENLFHTFGSVGSAWIFSKEKFIDKHLPFISFGKLKGSYGTTGNDQIDDYRILNRYTPINADVPYQNSTGLTINELPNPYLQWEKTKKLEFGIDLGFFTDKILATVYYYSNETFNQLLPYSLPLLTGFDGIIKNFPAKVRNKGWEFSINTVNITSKKFRWSTDANLTIAENKLVSYPDFESSPYARTLEVGQSINIQKVYHFLGVNSGTGIYQFADKNGHPTSDPDPDELSII
ncbi:MAG: SusC/RagA family TonB-linked outer membrane protein, partial [Chitinophagaceae bacterium]|nr:SusC/RagA family TonB-linked outer membrane protein [Chitinophagaceae bacterium]